MNTQTNFGQKVNNIIDNSELREIKHRQGFAGLQYVGQTKRAANIKKEPPSEFGVYAHAT